MNYKYVKIVEYTLYLRDRNPKKDWGHIRGWTTIFSYCRWNQKENFLKDSEKFFLEKYNGNDMFLKMISEWYYGKFQRSTLDKYEKFFNDNYLYNFMYAISSAKVYKHDYYFRFSESIDKVGFLFLMKSYSQNSNYLFTNIALGSYNHHHQNFNLAYKFYKQALYCDEDNPWLLAKIAILFSSMGLGEKGLLRAQETMLKVVNLLPKSPWSNAWYGETLNMVGKYYEALSFFKKYELLTENKHRTFEPFMRKAESYIGLGDFKKARIELNKEKQYYFGEGYRFIYNEIDKKLTLLGY